MMMYSSVLPGRYASTLFTVARVLSIFTFREARRFMGQNYDDLVFHIPSTVIVILKLVGRSAVSGEHQGPTSRARRREAERDEILIRLQLALRVSSLDREAIARSQPGAGDHCERLEIRTRARRLKSQLLEPVLDQLRGQSQALRPVPPPFHGRTGQGFDVLQIMLRVDAANCRQRNCCQRQDGYNLWSSGPALRGVLSTR